MEECDDIPWSQQVDEASYENLSSPTDTKGPCASIQFQNPPFIRAEIYTTEGQKKAQSNDPDYKRFKMYCNEEFQRSKKKGHESETPKDGMNDFQSLPAQSSKDVVAYVLAGGNEEHISKNYSSINVSTANDFNLPKKKITWASIASQPAKPNKRSSNTLLKKKGPGMPPPPMIPGKHNMEINSWEYVSTIESTETCETPPIFIPKTERSTFNEEDTVSKNLRPSSLEQHTSFIHKHPNFYSNNAIKNIKSSYKANDNSRRNIQKHNDEHSKNRRAASSNYIMSYKKDIHHEEENESNVCKNSNLILASKSQQSELADSSHKVLKKLKDRNNYNPSNMDLQIATLSRFFVIKSYSEDDIHRSIKYEIWCSTDHGNKRLDEAFKERTKEKGNVMLFFSVNGSGHFCGMAQMMTPVDYNSTSSVWSQDKWKGKFKVKWIYVKDVPNSQLRHIRLENNDNKSVTNSRDTQEVPNGKGLQVLKVLHSYKHQTSIFDDFYHYEKKQEEAVLKKPTQFDNFLQSSPSLNCYHNGIKEENDNRILGNLKDRPISHRGGFHNILGNRRQGRTLEIQLNQNEKVKWKLYESQDHENNETKTQNHQSYKPTCLEDCNSSNSEHNFKDIILHMNNFNCNENEILRANANAKLS